jgi:hypothetical protein
MELNINGNTYISVSILSVCPYMAIHSLFTMWNFFHGWPGWVPYESTVAMEGF